MTESVERLRPILASLSIDAFIIGTIILCSLFTHSIYPPPDIFLNLKRILYDLNQDLATLIKVNTYLRVKREESSSATLPVQLVRLSSCKTELYYGPTVDISFKPLKSFLLNGH